MADAGLDAILACDFATVYYLAGRVFDGFVYIPADADPVWFVKRPVHLAGDRVCHIRKPEDIPSALEGLGAGLPVRLGLEMDLCSYSLVERLKGAFPGAEALNASPALRAARSVKTEEELAQVRLSGAKHVGASGEEIRPGCTVMVDVNGNFTGYMTDMTRVYSLGTLPKIALDAHQCSVDIHAEFRRLAVAGASAKALYEMARGMAAERGFEKYFMGHRQQAGFVGHGVGIEINESPVLAPRSRDILEEGNVVALEPKFVIPGVGAVGIENTYIIHSDRAECVTDAPEDIIPLD